MSRGTNRRFYTSTTSKSIEKYPNETTITTAEPTAYLPQQPSTFSYFHFHMIFVVVIVVDVFCFLMQPLLLLFFVAYNISASILVLFSTLMCCVHVYLAIAVRGKHTYIVSGSHSPCIILFLFLFMPSFGSRSLLAVRVRYRRHHHRNRIEKSLVRAQQCIYKQIGVCITRFIQFSIRLYILRAVCFISFPSTAPAAVYIVTDFAVVYVHILYMHMSVCSG